MWSLDSLSALLVDAHPERAGQRASPAYHGKADAIASSIRRKSARRISPMIQDARKPMSRNDSDASMADSLSHPVEPANNPEGVSVSERLAKRWRVKPATAHWMVYGLERGLRGRCLDVVREMGPVKARAWFAVVQAALAEDSAAVTLHEKLIADHEEDVVTENYRDNPTPENRRRAYLAIEKEAAKGLLYAQRLRSEEEASRA